MFKVHVNDGASPIPTDDVCYIVAKEGIFLKKKMGVMESIAPVKNISILDSIESTAKMHIKKIPGGQFAKVIAFFKAVYAKYHGESIVLLFYDDERKIYKIVAPHQKVTMAACDYNKAITVEGMQMIGTIHSHASMSAFHSGVDDKDEEHFDGLHITIGNVNDTDVSITASIVANGHRFVVSPDEYVERLILTKDIDEVEQRPLRKTYQWIGGKLTEVTGKTATYSYRRYDKRYKVDVSDRYHKVPTGWMEMVEAGTYTYSYGNGIYGNPYTGGQRWNGYRNRRTGQGGWNKNTGWGGHYDSSLWEDSGRIAPSRTTPSGESPWNVGVKVKPIEFPKHDVQIMGEDAEFSPCTTCVFRGYKFMAEDEGLDSPEIYKCEKCDQIIVDDETDSEYVPICPVCNSDEFMTLLDEDDLPNQYTREDNSPVQKEAGIIEDSDYITCKLCSSTFRIYAGDTKCPYCYTEFDDESYSQETELTQQAIADSGGYLSAETEEINRAALEEAARADMEPTIPIVDPSSDAIPIPEQQPTKEEDRKLLGLLRSVFGGKK